MLSDTPQQAIRASIDAVGGPKVVGARLWPGLCPTKAQVKLANSTSPYGRREKLALEEVVQIFRMADEAGRTEGTRRFFDLCKSDIRMPRLGLPSSADQPTRH